MKDTWAYRLSFFTFHLLFGLGIAWVRALSLLPGPYPLFSYVRGLADNPTMLLHCSYYDITSLLVCCYLWAYGLRLLLVHFLHSFFFWASLASIPTEPAHSIPWAFSAYFIPWASSAHFLLPYLFYSHGFLLNPLGFSGPITASLPLITFHAYWPSCQPYEFTNSFLGLPQLIYFFSTSYYFHGFTTFILGAFSAHLLLLGHLLFLWACWPLFLPFWPVGFYFTIFPHLLHIIGLLLWKSN